MVTEMSAMGNRRQSNAFQPSSYQQRIFQFLREGTGHGLVDAVPGSGKTTTLLQAAQLLPRGTRALFVAFNTHIATELAAKLRAIRSPMRCSTIHSLGKRVLGQTQVETQKYQRLCKSYLEAQGVFNVTEQLKRLVDFVRLTLTDPRQEDALKTLVAYYDLDIDVFVNTWPIIWRGVEPVLRRGSQGAEAGVIDFTDMIWLPTVLDLPCPSYDYVFVDECQDLNAAQLALVMRCCPSGRMLFVGDKHQSLYGFAGANTQSIEHIIEQTHATVLPLSICYRCPSQVIDLAAQVYPGIEVASHAPTGTIATIEIDQLADFVTPGDMVLCRTTAPLVEQCLALLRQGIKAKVRGKDLGTIFVNLLNQICRQPYVSLPLLQEAAEAYRQEQARALSALPDYEMKVAMLSDKIDTFLSLLEAYQGQKRHEQKSSTGFEAYLQDFFRDDAKGIQPVVFSTIHKAKGLEVDRVFLLRSDLIPHPAAKQDWQVQQEYNMEYVALTRAKDTLCFVGEVIENLTLPEPGELHSRERRAIS